MPERRNEKNYGDLIGVCWYTTTRCVIAGADSKCDKCLALQGFPDAPIETQLDVIDALALSGIVKLSFGGQEPTLVPHLPELIKRAKEKMMTTALFTTGFGLKRIIDEIEPYLDHLALPLDGSSREINALGMGGNLKHFDMVTSLIPQMAQRKFNLEVSTTVTRRNIGNLLDLGSLVQDLGAPKWKVFEFVPLEVGMDNRDDLMLGPDDFGRVGSILSEAFPQLDIDIQPGDRTKLGSYFVIGPNGDAYATNPDYQHVKVGNVIETSAQQLWRSPEFDHGRDRHVSRHIRDL